jgi:DNA-directed RNA polymerase subunit B"
VISPLSRAQPHFEARDLHPTQWGRLCPSETPEGPNCGLVKNFAQMVELSTGVDEKSILKKIIMDLDVKPTVPHYRPEKVVEYDAELEEYTEEFDTVPHEEEKPDLGYSDYSDMDDSMGGFADD